MASVQVFFGDYWNTIEPKMSSAILEFLSGGSMATYLNHNHIALIPKVKTPNSVNDFRPIK